ncbi:MAG: hypothetical protein WDN46_01820 [Methylocella sp.]
MYDGSEGDIFANAAIKQDGNVQTWNDSRREIARIDSNNSVYWFTTDLRFDDNRNDFWLVIQYFGFRNRDTVGNKMGAGRQIFTPKQAESVEKRIIEYYSSPENKRMYPFNRRASKFLGVIFEDGWILG